MNQNKAIYTEKSPSLEHYIREKTPFVLKRVELHNMRTAHIFIKQQLTAEPTKINNQKISPIRNLPQLTTRQGRLVLPRRSTDRNAKTVNTLESIVCRIKETK